jgi:hypothetical protein
MQLEPTTAAQAVASAGKQQVLAAMVTNPDACEHGTLLVVAHVRPPFELASRPVLIDLQRLSAPLLLEVRPDPVAAASEVIPLARSRSGVLYTGSEPHPNLAEDVARFRRQRQEQQAQGLSGDSTARPEGRTKKPPRKAKHAARRDR